MPVLSDFQNFDFRRNKGIFSSNFGLLFSVGRHISQMAYPFLMILHSLIKLYLRIMPVLSNFQNFNFRRNKAIFTSNFLQISDLCLSVGRNISQMTDPVLMILHILMKIYPGIMPALLDFPHFDLRRNKAIFTSNFLQVLDLCFFIGHQLYNLCLYNGTVTLTYSKTLPLGNIDSVSLSCYRQIYKEDDFQLDLNWISTGFMM